MGSVLVVSEHYFGEGITLGVVAEKDRLNDFVDKFYGKGKYEVIDDWEDVGKEMVSLRKRIAVDGQTGTAVLFAHWYEIF